jgi:hypothetical protein
MKTKNKLIIAAIIVAGTLAFLYWKYSNDFFAAFYTIGI